jgi:hypothetical protein
MTAPLYAARVLTSRWLGAERFVSEPVGFELGALLDRLLEQGIDSALVVPIEDARRIAALPKGSPPPRFVDSLVVSVCRLADEPAPVTS